MGQKAADDYTAELAKSGFPCGIYMVGGGLDHTFLDREIDEKLFVRSAAMQSLLPMMQFSAAPWRHLSPEGVILCRAFADLHIAFGPYIMETARHAAKTVELPAGRWRDDLGEEHVGPKTLNLQNVPLDRLPRYERIVGISPHPLDGEAANSV